MASPCLPLKSFAALTVCLSAPISTVTRVWSPMSSVV